MESPAILVAGMLRRRTLELGGQRATTPQMRDLLHDTLAASASHIAVAAALRMSVPEGEPSLHVGTPPGSSFPFNTLLGLPLCEAAATALLGNGTVWQRRVGAAAAMTSARTRRVAAAAENEHDVGARGAGGGMGRLGAHDGGKAVDAASQRQSTPADGNVICAGREHPRHDLPTDDGALIVGRPLHQLPWHRDDERQRGGDCGDGADDPQRERGEGEAQHRRRGPGLVVAAVAVPFAHRELVVAARHIDARPHVVATEAAG
ncbi:MAG: sodium-dependent bicarbonate transport family permease [Planctomycetota bacterium]